MNEKEIAISRALVKLNNAESALRKFKANNPKPTDPRAITAWDRKLKAKQREVQHCQNEVDRLRGI